MITHGAQLGTQRFGFSQAMSVLPYTVFPGTNSSLNAFSTLVTDDGLRVVYEHDSRFDADTYSPVSAWSEQLAAQSDSPFSHEIASSHFAGWQDIGVVGPTPFVSPVTVASSVVDPSIMYSVNSAVNSFGEGYDEYFQVSATFHAEGEALISEVEAFSQEVLEAMPDLSAELVPLGDEEVLPESLQMAGGQPPACEYQDGKASSERGRQPAGTPPGGKAGPPNKKKPKAGAFFFDATQAFNQLMRAPGDALKCASITLNNINAEAFQGNPFYDRKNPLSWFIHGVSWMLGGNKMDRDARNDASAGYNMGNAFLKLGSYVIGTFTDAWNIIKFARDKYDKKDLESKGFDITKTSGSFIQRASFLVEKITSFVIKARLKPVKEALTSDTVRELAYMSAAGTRELARFSSIVAMVGGIILGATNMVDNERKKRKAKLLGKKFKPKKSHANLSAKMLSEALPRMVTQIYCLWSYYQLKAYAHMEKSFEDLPEKIQDSVTKMDYLDPSALTEDQLYVWLNGGYDYPIGLTALGVGLAAVAGVYAPWVSFRDLRKGLKERKEYRKKGDPVPQHIKEELIADGLSSAAAAPLFIGGIAAAYPATDPHAFAFLSVGAVFLTAQFVYENKTKCKELGGKLKGMVKSWFGGGASTMVGADTQEPGDSVVDSMEAGAQAALGDADEDATDTQPGVKKVD